MILYWGELCASSILLGFVLFSQITAMQAYSYPFLLFHTFLFFKMTTKGCRLLFVFFAISCITIASVTFRGGSAELALALIRYFYGFLLVGALLSFSKKKFTLVHWLMFCGICVAELILSNFSFPLPYVSRFVDETFEGRNLIDNSFFRVLGPSLNSSVSGSLSFILAFFLLIDRKLYDNCYKKSPSKKLKYLVVLLLFLAGFSCGSGTAITTLLFLSFVICIKSKSKIIKLIKNTRNCNQIIKIIFLILVSLLFVEALFPSLVFSLLIGKFSNNYFQDIIALKSAELQDLYKAHHWLDILFGIKYEMNNNSICFGGDFVLLSFVRELGLIALAFVLYIAYSYTNRKYWHLISAIMISSIHYGTAFALTGQIIFGYLISLEE